MSNPVIQKATAHFREKLNAGLNSIEVPEWQSKIYFKPSTTLKEQSRLIELAQQGKTVEALVETLIVKARNEDGTKMFTVGDKVTLMNEVDPSIIIRIVGEINETSDAAASMGEVEKN
jgi:hypothetical protein